MRKIDSDIWVKAMPAWTKDADVDVVIPDLRHVNEFEAVLEAGGQVWKVVRPGSSPRGMDTLLDHISESEWDYVIGNTGTLEDLQTVIDIIMNDELYKRETYA